MNTEIKLTEEELHTVKRRLDNELFAVENRLRHIAAEREAAKWTKLQPVAEIAHNVMCGYNHTDGCGYLYENDNWSADCHVAWLRKVNNVLEKNSRLTLEHLKEMLLAVQALTKKYPELVRTLRTF
jgi:hypothetical protein